MSTSVILGNAYFIHPYAGQVIYVPHSHISLVISNPEKFRVNFEFIKTFYEKYYASFRMIDEVESGPYLP
jgi:hypothetical protein